MQQTEEKDTKQPLAPTEPVSEPLTPLAPDAVKRADDDDNPDAIFFRAVSEIPTQSLNHHFTPQWEIERKIQWYYAFTLFLFLFSLIASVILHLINQPVITVTLLPVHTSRQITTTLLIPTRTLAPVTISKALSVPTTGKGHQDARAATGTLTFYNGQFSGQTVAIGTVFIGRDRQKVVTEASVTIPAANPPQVGEATVSARVLNAGSQGNIAEDEIESAVSSDLLVKNLAAFTGGRDARDYHAVVQHDLDTLTAKLQQQLTKEMPQAFSIDPVEEVTPTNCSFTESADHGLAEEAQMLTVKASKTCAAIAYNQDELTTKATAAFTSTRPGKKYELVGSVRLTVLSVSPFLVRGSGQWEYAITRDDEYYLAQQIQGETPVQARAYLLKTGLVSRVTITQTPTLPDFYHLKFLILIGV